MKPTRIIMTTTKPDINTVENGCVVRIVDANGIYWGSYVACQNWCRERFWMEFFHPYGD